MDKDEREGIPRTAEPAPPSARVTHVQWLDEPIPTTAPPSEASRGWDWRWVLAFVGAGLAAFVAAMAIATGGFRPVEVGPATPVVPIPLTPATTPTPVPSPVATSEPEGAVNTGPIGQQYGQYTNERYNYAFVYPEDLLLPQGESADGASQQFISADGETLVSVGAAPNPTGMTLEEAYAHARQPAGGREVTYKASGPTWYVVSGYEGSRLFYEKTFLIGDTFKTLAISFPRQHRAQYYDLVEEMSNSFKSLD